PPQQLAGGEDLLEDAIRAANHLRSIRSRLGHRPDLQHRLDALVAVLESQLFARAAGVHNALEQLQELQRFGQLDPDDFGIESASGNLWLSERGNDILERAIEPDDGSGGEDATDDAGEAAAAVAAAAGPMSVSELHPLTEAELSAWLATAAGGRRIIESTLEKRPGQPLGFSVVGVVRDSGELGIFVQGVREGSPADREGRLEEKDQLLAINAIPLDGRLKPQLVVELLQSVSDRVRLHLCRHRTGSDTQLNQQQQQSEQNLQQQQQQAGLTNSFDLEQNMLNTEWTELEVIDLANDGSGLGFGIIGSKSTGVVVRTILPGGVADADGRLRSGDHLLYICPVNVRGMTSEQVATVLRQSGDRVRLVVARVVRDESEAAAAAASSDADTDGRCRQLVPTAELDDRLDDLVATLDALDQARVVVLMPQEVATEAQSDSLHLPGVTNPPPIIEPAKMSAPPPPPPAAAEVETDYEEFFVELHRGSSGLGITIAGYVGETSTAKLNGIFIKEIADGSAADKDGRLRVNDRIVQVDSVSLDGYTNQEAVEILKRAGSAVQLKLLRYNRGPIYEQLQTNTAALSPAQYKTVVAQRVPDLDGENDPAEESDFSAPLSDADMAALQTRWRLELGDPDCEIVVAQFAKFSDSPGLGISLEGTVDVLENGDEARPHHYIREVVPDGPAGREGTLRRRDELLEVNNRRVLGLNHLEVVEVLKSLPQQVCIVCARSTQPEIDEMDEYEDQAADEEVDSDSASASAVVVGGASGGKSRSVEDFSGMGVWSDQATEVELEKTARGLGFSVLDYQDPLCSDRTVIIVRSLVPGGLAHKDGRILPGDRLLYVNDVRLEQATLEEAVQCLKSAPEGRIVIGVAKPSPLAAASVDAAAALAAAVAKPPATSSHARQASDLSQLTIDTGTSGDNVSLSSFDSHKTDGDDTATADTPEPRRCSLSDGKSDGDDADQEEAEDEEDEEELPPIPSALERTLKLRKSGFEELGLVIAAGGKGTNGCVVTEVLPGSAAARSGTLQPGDYVTAVNSESLRRLDVADARAALRRAAELSDISVIYIPSTDAEVHLQSMQFARQEAKKFSANQPKQRLSRKSGDSEA
ncbi:hypothetical protein BOX15_Mlig032896g2, partial [Macrostomum lignano]